MQWLSEHLPESAAAALTAAATFFTKRIWSVGPRIAKLDAHLTKLDVRVAKLEGIAITREDFDELRMLLTASITNVGTRLEKRTDDIMLLLAKGNQERG